ncbi:MAG: four helix bundle protein [Candidatus Zixiibacteriota bacterium]|nr:MAG: four helix bundle protein [candidate division Zixibacteria bacterium]
MKVESFEDLLAWSKGRELVNKIYSVPKKEEFCRDKALVYQIRRAVISVMSNISEGFEGGSNKEFVQFLYIAKASCGEVRCHIAVASDQGYIDKDEFREMRDLAREVSGIIGNFIRYLRGSRVKGSKFKPKPGDLPQQERDAVESKDEVIKPLNS